MAYKKAFDPIHAPEDQIVIERREIIATLNIYEDGGVPALGEAMRIAGLYLSENMTLARMNLEFTAFGRHFTIAVDGDEPMEK